MHLTPSRPKKAYIDSRLQADIAFPVKFHRPILEDEAMRSLVEARFRAVAKDLSCTILHLEIRPDHVRMRVELPADLSALAFTTKLKADSSRALYAAFPALKGRLTTLWPWSCYFRSAASSLPGGIEDFMMRDRGLHNAC
jgi:REP element-mobilizing transposase RayT